jgi:hypothetical protein
MMQNQLQLAERSQACSRIRCGSGITSNLTADLTLNTDFAQVESDNAQINLTRFPFFPGKIVFRERTSNFTFAFDDMNALFLAGRWFK